MQPWSGGLQHPGGSMQPPGQDGELNVIVRQAVVRITTKPRSMPISDACSLLIQRLLQTLLILEL